MPKRALIVGIDNYLNTTSLAACVSDALAIQSVLQQHQDGTPNYSCQMLLARSEDHSIVSRARLRGEVQNLFKDFADDVLFYFSGHGAPTALGGLLATSDGIENDIGIPMNEIVHYACQSRASNITLILDCCYSGAIGNSPMMIVGSPIDPIASLRENMTVIAASRATEVAVEDGVHGMFTGLVLDALTGGAADHLGWVTGPAVYSYVERHFGPWDQRPVYKSHATRVVVLRKCAPLVDRATLSEMTKLFPNPTQSLELDPEFEPEDGQGLCKDGINAEKVRVAKVLKTLRDVGLVQSSIPGEQFYWTARLRHSVQLTSRGREYWRLVQNNRV